jgi:hypothetical protein
MDATSIADKISGAFAKTARKLHDVNIAALGTKTDVLRLALGEKDKWGDSIDSLRDFVISNVYIRHPQNNLLQIFQQRDVSTGDTQTNATDLFEFLPIQIKVPFFGDKESAPVELFKGDMLVQVMFDEHLNKIPLLLEITQSFASVAIKHIIAKPYNATLFRGTPSDDISAAVKLYVQSLS